MDGPTEQRGTRPGAGLWRRLPLVAGLLLLGILLAACQHPTEETLWGEALQADAGDIRGLTPERARSHPTAMHLDEENREAYVTLGGTIGRPDRRIAVVDLETGDRLEPIDVGMRPLDIQGDPRDPSRLFVAHPYSPSLSVIDTEAKSVMQILEAPYYLERIALTGNGSLLLATDRANDRLVVFDLQRETPGYILNERFHVPTGPNPEEVQIVPPGSLHDWPDDRLVAVTDRHGGSITLIDLETGDHRRVGIDGPPLALAARDGLLFIAGVGPGDGTPADLSGTPETGTADLENSVLVLDLRAGPRLVQTNETIPRERFLSDTARPDNAPAQNRILGGALPGTLRFDDEPLPGPASQDDAGDAILWVGYRSSDQVQALHYHRRDADSPLDATVLTTLSGTSGERLSHLENERALGPGRLGDAVHGLFETPPGPRGTARLDDLLITIAELPEQLHLTNLADCPGPTDPTAPCTTGTIDLVDDPVAYPTGEYERGERLFKSAFPSADQDRSAIMCHPEGLATGGTWALPHRDLRPVKIPRLDQVADNAPWLIDGSVQHPEGYFDAAAGDMLKADPGDPNNLANPAPADPQNATRPDADEDGDEDDPQPAPGPGPDGNDTRFPGALERLQRIDPEIGRVEDWMRLSFAYLMGERRVPPPPPFITTPDGQDMQRGMRLFMDSEIGCASCHIGGGAGGNLLGEQESQGIPSPPNATRMKTPPLGSVWDREATGLLWTGEAPRIESTVLPTGHPCLGQREPGLEHLWHGDATGRTCESIQDLAAYVRGLEEEG